MRWGALIKGNVVFFGDVPNKYFGGRVHGDEYLTTYPSCQTVVFNLCDKNLVYEVLEPRKFPNLQIIMLNAHPCEPDVFYRDFPNLKAFMITDKFGHYVRLWAPNRGIRIIGERAFEKKVNEFFD
jgi:hypothetical protein